jgi:ASC-1-like (ASCH) protein
LTNKILTGEKTIESRWYKSKRPPWVRISTGDTVYFKNSGDLVRIRAEVKNVVEITDLTPDKVKAVLVKYGKKDGIEKDDARTFYYRFKNKRYCILVFLKNAAEVKPFQIDKRGFGVMSAWIYAPTLLHIRA